MAFWSDEYHLHANEIIMRYQGLLDVATESWLIPAKTNAGLEGFWTSCSCQPIFLGRERGWSTNDQLFTQLCPCDKISGIWRSMNENVGMWEVSGR